MSSPTSRRRSPRSRPATADEGALTLTRWLPPLELALLAVALAWPAPRIMARLKGFRRAPLEALVVWQAVSVAGVVSALAVGPAAVATDALPRWAEASALAFSTGMLLRLLWSGHRIGNRLRSQRREHRELIDVLGTVSGHDVRVLAHPTPTAYCVPGLRRRVVLTQGALDALPPEELAAVMSHERAHLRTRHDLVLEFFTVLHEAVPPLLRASAALREVRLLVEVLADRAATRVAGPVPLARALVALAGGARPDATLGAPATESVTRARLDLLAADDPPRWLRAAMLAFAVMVFAAPLGLLAAALR